MSMTRSTCTAQLVRMRHAAGNYDLNTMHACVIIRESLQLLVDPPTFGFPIW